ncbi:hypothetical protein Trydic_g14974 [Trypoxylus dichotomus]
MILRYLDPRSLVNASHACHYWSYICAKDPVLRRRILKQEKVRKRLRWCRAKYGDGTLKTNKLYRRSKELMRKQKFRVTQLKYLRALINLRNMLQGFYNTLLAATW